MKVIKVLGGLVAAVFVILAAGAAWLLYRIDSYDPAWQSIDITARVLARHVDLAVADISPGEYPTVGFERLTASIGNYGGTVLASRADEHEVLADPYSWVDAEFRGGADGQTDEIRCVRFELRWDHYKSTTWHQIDCP
ncbi:hypothetical protein [Actinoplanes sp. L3-i22]|uniref:hypothetical protein n=1 Tax=Actinoplanes sp. L3-i22 TaxID=2836373 RepID=UPI001C780E1F|nr:hypothetical protein [Actinoplanes sp. L3-i22]BCY14667.1 hypothetical protein L3i22_097550 [Actinoplanes sp. L3-i22]